VSEDREREVPFLSPENSEGWRYRREKEEMRDVVQETEWREGQIDNR